MNKNLIFVLTLFCYSIIIGQTTKDLNIKYMLRGQIYAESSIKDSTAFGGFAEFGALPKKINNENNFPENGVFLNIDTTKTIVINEKINGYKLYIGNKSDSIAKFEASDSRLYVIAEVFYKEKWQPIEYLSSSWCGNSYHYVFLNQNEYWEFDIPKFTGKIKSRLRYKLINYGNTNIYSNEIEVSFNKKQLTKKEGHRSNGLMDPYNE